MPELIPAASLFPIAERLIWSTRVLRGADGTPQRVSLRKVPRQQVPVTCVFGSDAEASQMHAMLHDGAKGLWYVPLWFERVRHAGSLAPGATSLSIDTTASDFRSSGGGAYALIWQDESTHEVVTVSNVAAGSITISATTKTYTGSKAVMPCRTGYLLSPPQFSRASTWAQILTAEFEVVDNQYLTGHAAATSYDNVEVLTTPAKVPNGAYGLQIDPDCLVIDTTTGRRILEAVTDFNRSTQTHQFVHTTAADCWSFRKWLHWLNGAQKSFFVPTFRDDITLAVACGSTDTSITVVNRGFGDHMGYNMLRSYVAFRPAGGDIIVRRVDAMTELSASQEQFTLDAAPGDDFALGDSLSWVDRCTLASDVVQIQWLQPGLQIVDVNMERVVNDWPVLDWGVFGSGVMAG